MHDFNTLNALLVDYIDSQKFNQGPQNLYEPVRYILKIGGKRIRPILSLMAAQLFEGDPKTVLPGAFAVEMFHNFSLLHDDIMDEAPLRRGKEAVHIKYGLNAGILSGDVMLVLVYQYLLKMKDAADFAFLTAQFNQAAIEVCEGQQLDVDFETRSEVSEKEYLSMIEKKTAALLGVALTVGAAPFTSQRNLELLDDFGRNLGISFQLIDDLLDTFGDTHKVGKQKGGDIIQNKKTILVIRALENASADQKKELRNWYSSEKEHNHKEKIDAVSQLFIETGAKSATEKLADDYQERAIYAMEKIDASEELKGPLLDLARKLLNREH